MDDRAVLLIAGSHSLVITAVIKRRVTATEGQQSEQQINVTERGLANDGTVFLLFLNSMHHPGHDQCTLSNKASEFSQDSAAAHQLKTSRFWKRRKFKWRSPIYIPSLEHQQGLERSDDPSAREEGLFPVS
jgi:hypothetical protein